MTTSLNVKFQSEIFGAIFYNVKYVDLRKAPSPIFSRIQILPRLQLMSPFGGVKNSEANV